MKKILLALLLFAPTINAAVEASKPAATSDDWGGVLNANTNFNGAWLNQGDSTYPGAGQATYLGWELTRYYAHSTTFPGIDIPQGSTIDSAEYWVRSGCNACTDSMILVASILDADNGVQITDTQGFRTYFAQVATGANDKDTAYVPTATSWGLGAYVRLPLNKLKGVIQNNISRAGWLSGNSITLFVTPWGGALTSTLRRATRSYSYSGGTTYDSLWISYTAGGGGSPSATPNVVVRTATLRTTTLRAPEKMFYRKENWRW